jgi:cbb3-type cytochrome oxidase maturation protein
MSLAWSLFLICFLMGLAAWLIFWWSVRTGQFQEAEVTAAEMLVNDELEGTGASRATAEEIFRRERALVGAPSEESRA